MELLGMYVMDCPPLGDRYICFDSRFQAEIDKQKRRVSLTFQDKEGTHPISMGLWDKVLAFCQPDKGADEAAQGAGITNVNLIIGKNGTGKTTLSFLIGQMIRQLRTRGYAEEFSGLSLWLETETEAGGNKRKAILFYPTETKPWTLEIVSDRYEASCCHDRDAFLLDNVYSGIPYAVLISNSLENRWLRQTKDWEQKVQESVRSPELEQQPLNLKGNSSQDDPEISRKQAELEGNSIPTRYDTEVRPEDAVIISDYTPQTVLFMGSGDSGSVQNLFEEKALLSAPSHEQFFDAQMRWILFQLWCSPKLEDIREAEQMAKRHAGQEAEQPSVLDQVQLVLLRPSEHRQSGTFWDTEIKRACGQMLSHGGSFLEANFLDRLEEIADALSASGLTAQVERKLSDLIRDYEDPLALDSFASSSDACRRINFDFRCLGTLLAMNMLFQWRNGDTPGRVTLRCQDFNRAATPIERFPAIERTINDYLRLWSENRSRLPELRLEGSSGQINFQMLLASLCHAVSIFTRRTRPILLIIDEADLSFHPEWQRTFLLKLLCILSRLSSNSWQIILATHSPILLSDFPASSRILLPGANTDHAESKTVGNDDTFAQNIYRLYSDQMHLSSATGSFAQVYLKKLATSISSMSKDDAPAQYKALKAQIELIGDPVLRQIYQRQLDRTIVRFSSGDKRQTNKLLTELVKEADSKTKELLLAEFVNEADSKTKELLRELLKEP